MTTEEREVNYCFHINDYPRAKEYIADVLGKKPKILRSDRITDHYLSREIRIREKGDKLKLYRKSGDKATKRIEEVTEISHSAFDILRDRVQMTVEKTRQTIVSDNDEELFVLDIIDKPMKVAMVEIEFLNEASFHYAVDTFEKEGLQRNTKNAWDYFHRRIGIAGPASSGKSAVCRSLVNKLAIEYDAQVEQVMEYARSHIARYGVPSWTIQPLIEWGQVRREQDASGSIMTVTDSPTFLPYFYTLYNFREGLDATSIFILGQMYKGAMYAVTKYSEILLLRPQRIKEDGVRVQTYNDTKELFNLIEAFLDQHNVPHIKGDYNIDIDLFLRKIFNLNKV